MAKMWISALLGLMVASATVAQDSIVFRGEKVTWVSISEDNSYRDWDSREYVYPPNAFVEYRPYNMTRMLLKRKARRTQTSEMDSSALHHLDSLMAEIGVCRPATAADLGITEKVFKKTLSEWKVKRWLNRHYLEDISLEGFDQWLMEQYEQFKERGILVISSDKFGYIRIHFNLAHGKTGYVSIWRDGPEEPFVSNSGYNFNLNLYRHLCALMPKTFDYSYEDFQRRLILSYLEHLETNIY